jgi:myo-inositol 2-dehydrogenase/D-chiro-inositol 1-dehydrogenase
MMISDSAIHEIDLVRWLFEEEVAAASIMAPRRTSKAGQDLQDPLIVLLEMTSGVLVDVEVFVNAGYGYDIRAEIVGESGTVALADPGPFSTRRRGQLGGAVPADWRDRFGASFDAEFRDWLGAVAAGTCGGPSCWDGLAATAVADSCLEALATGRRAAVTLPPRPDFYAKQQ